ncbi:SusC/RagA family TonB-linked outer membrane protein [Solitalea longa]|nr:SusC/RagA family TonB-linked outer membrane protein [Solitalea longa]
MKLTFLLVLAAIMQVSASTYAQRITLSVKNAELVTVFDKISDQTGYDFVVTNSILKRAGKVTLDVKNVELKEVMEQIFKNQPFEFSINNNTVLVKKKPAPHAVTIVSPVATIDVTGKVADDMGIPLSGAVIKVKGTSIQTSANENGEFTLRNVDENAVLIISFLGYKTREVKASKDLGTLFLAIDQNELKEVSVSTGYQTIPKERVTGSFSSVPAKELEHQRLSNINSLLEGRIPGYNNGVIRGTTSMNGVTTPLYVIDGFPVENTRYSASGNIEESVPGLNLEDIETITVLKDAAAASIYGARAANGVVVIVTKKGKKGKPQVSFSSTFTMSPYKLYTNNITNSADIVALEKEWAANNPNLQGSGAADYANSLLENAVYPSQGINSLLRYYSGSLSTTELDTKLNQLSAGGYQYYDDVKNYSKRDPFFQQYNLNIANATDKNSLYSSVTYRNNKFEDKYSDNESLGLNLKNTTFFNKWFTLELSNYFDYGKTNRQSYSTLSPGYSFQAYDRLVNADGSHFTSTAESRLSANTMSLINDYNLYNMDINALDEQQMNVGESKSYSNRSFIKLKADITKWLSFSPTFQYEFGNDRLNQLYNKNSYYVRNRVNGFASYSADKGFNYNLPYGNIFEDQNQYTSSYNFRQQFNVDKTFGQKHNLTAIVGSEIRNAKLEYKSGNLYNYDPTVLSFDLIDAKELANVDGAILGGQYFSSSDIALQRETVNRFVSLYSNAGYSYDDRYLATASIRWDRSNLWGTNSKYQNKPLWSVGAGWNIHREAFFNVKWVDLLKLRASYGISGNIAKDAAPYMTAYYYANNNVGGLQGSISARPNPLLSWEKTGTTNIGVDYGFFQNRLTGSIDFYSKKGENLLANTMGVPTEGFGYSTYSINNGEMLNKGVEVSLSADIIRKSNIRWNTTLQYAHNKNEVTYVNVEAPVYFLQLDYPEAYPRIGNPYQAIYSYRWAGLSEDGLPQVYNENGEKMLYSPGSLESIVYSGSTVPTYSGSFNNLLDYKNFTFSFLLTFEGGHKMRNSFLPMLGNSYNSAVFSYVSQIGPVNKDIVNRWKSPGDEAKTDVPRAVFAEDPNYSSDSYEIYRNADINVLDASNIRLRNISLAYTLPQKLTKKAALSNVRLQFNAENLFTIAKSETAKYLLDGFRSPNYVWGVYMNF